MRKFILTLTMGLFLIGGFCSESLTIKGNIIGDRADIKVYQHIGGSWQIIEELSNKSSYSIKLDGSKNYQIFFDNGECVKCLHVDASTPIEYKKYVDIDFSSDYRNAKIYKYKDGYKMVLVDSGYLSPDITTRNYYTKHE